MLVFAVETSCDETSVCILDNNKTIFSHIVFSQKEHAIFGGVIPEIASRAHLQILQIISKDALKEAKKNVSDIDLFCATCGPGLIGGLLVGSTFTKSLALGVKKPFIPINHLEGHILSPTFNNKIDYPHVSFVLTGGHTQIYLINSVNDYLLLGETLDDAIGEAFDKVAKLLKLSYPGGPEIEKAAKNGNALEFELPEPLKKKKDLNFSFSGIKTAANLIVSKQKNINEKFIANLAASFQKKITDILISKIILTIKYLNKKNIYFSQISLVGGVAANEYIYTAVKNIVKKYSCSVILPPKYMLGDNAAMIGWACIQKNSRNQYSDIFFKADPKLTIKKTNL